MQFPIVREYRTDLDMSLEENKIRGEVRDLPIRFFTHVIIPKYAPFYVESLELRFPNGEPMIRDKHYKVYTIMGHLSQLTNKAVASMIEILDKGITAVEMDYHTLGHLSILDKSMVSLIEQAMNDDRLIDWDNMSDKPIVFPPTLHSESLVYDFHGMEDIISTLDLLEGLIADKPPDIMEVKARGVINSVNSLLDRHIEPFREYIERHTNAKDAHGITKGQLDLDQVDNVGIAKQEDLISLKDNVRVTTNQIKTILDNHDFGKEKFLEESSLPFSQYIKSNSFSKGGFQVTIPSGEEVIIRGKSFYLPLTVISLYDITPAPRNRVFYLYAVHENNEVSYQVLLDSEMVNESLDRLLIAKITAGSSQVDTIEVNNVLNVNGYTISTTRRGGVIPASTGSINEEGDFRWIKDPDDFIY